MGWLLGLVHCTVYCFAFCLPLLVCICKNEQYHLCGGSEFQMRVARGLTLQQREEEEERQVGEEQRTVLGGLKADKKNRVGTTRTGSAKLG